VANAKHQQIMWYLNIIIKPVRIFNFDQQSLNFTTELCFKLFKKNKIIIFLMKKGLVHAT